MAPRADVRAPLVMERLLERDPMLLARTAGIVELARRLPAPWQRLVSAELSNMEAQLIYERFVGVTLRDLSTALRATGRVLPVEVLRAVIEQICDGLGALPPVTEATMLSDRSVGLSIDGQWRFAPGALNHWLVHGYPGTLIEADVDPVTPDSVFFLSPEGISGRPETPASLPSRAALFAWQLATGGFHPYRGDRNSIMASITRFSRDEVRVPLSVHPDLTPAIIEVLTRGVSFSRNRFVDLASFRVTLDAAWPVPPASSARTLEVIASLTWSTVQKELRLLKREPMLPIRWDGVWSASRTPEEGIAVLEDQLLERLEPVDRYPRRGPIEDPTHDVSPQPSAPPVPILIPPAVPRAGLLQRFLALFRR